MRGICVGVLWSIRGWRNGSETCFFWSPPLPFTSHHPAPRLPVRSKRLWLLHLLRSQAEDTYVGHGSATRFPHIISIYCVYLYFKTLASHPLLGSRGSVHTHSRLRSGDVWECGGAASEDVYTALRGGRIVFPSGCASVCVCLPFKEDTLHFMAICGLCCN